MTVLPNDEGKGSSPSDPRKGKSLESKPPRCDTPLPGSTRETSPPGSMIPNLSDVNVAPSNPRLVTKPRVPSFDDHMSFWKSSFDSLTIPKQEYLTHVVD